MNKDSKYSLEQWLWESALASHSRLIPLLNTTNSGLLEFVQKRIEELESKYPSLKS